mgnify:CR=1 FL=1|tara:strand:- start:255 stop:497 length:243 start_codon:yes stop_codon:yes gene_type:complete
METNTKSKRKLWASIPITEQERQLIETIQIGLKQTIYQDIPLSRILRALCVSGIKNIDPELAIEDPTLVFQMEAHGSELL